QACIDAGHAAVEVGFVLWGQAAAGLRAGRAVAVRADGIAGRVAGAGPVTLDPVLGTDGEGVRGLATVEAADQVEIGQGLREGVVAGLEPGGAGRAERAVDRVAQAVGEFVAAVVHAAVHVPAAERCAHAGDEGGVEVLADRDRAESVRVDLRPVGAALGIAEVVGAFGVAL